MDTYAGRPRTYIPFIGFEGVGTLIQAQELGSSVKSDHARRILNSNNDKELQKSNCKSMTAVSLLLQVLHYGLGRVEA